MAIKIAIGDRRQCPIDKYEQAMEEANKFLEEIGKLTIAFHITEIEGKPVSHGQIIIGNTIYSFGSTGFQTGPAGEMSSGERVILIAGLTPLQKYAILKQAVETAEDYKVFEDFWGGLPLYHYSLGRWNCINMSFYILSAGIPELSFMVRVHTLTAEFAIYVLKEFGFIETTLSRWNKYKYWKSKSKSQQNPCPPEGTSK